MKKTHWIFWLLSPTYKFSEYQKNKLLKESNDGAELVTNRIKKYNKITLICTLFIFIVLLMVDVFNYYHFEYKNYITWIQNYFSNDWIVWILGYIVFSRAFEIFKAFLDDAVEKLNRDKSASELHFGDRLRLAFNSYIELIVGFGIFYYLLPCGYFKSGSDSFHFTNIIEAIYLVA